MKFLDQEKRRQLLNERHSCKMFDSHYEFSSEELEEIAEIARLSPSSYNTQPWHFVMVTNKDLKPPKQKSQISLVFGMNALVPLGTI